MSEGLPDITYDLRLLERSAAKWAKSPALRAFYGDLWREVAEQLRPGPVLELGSGIGTGREFVAGLTTSDLVKTRYVDIAASAYEIERTGADWANVVAVDMLHHLRQPLRFLESAARALVPGGRVVLAEPAATWGGCRFYRRFHHEPCAPNEIVPPFAWEGAGEFANMGMGVALFRNHAAAVSEKLASFGMRLCHVGYRDLLAYPLTGGFSHRALLPATGLRALLALERTLPKALLERLALRMVIVVEKNGGGKE